MLVAEEFVGNRDDDAVASRVEGADHLTITVDDTERRRSRFRTTAENGRQVGVVVARELRDGDVLDAEGRFVVVSLKPVDAMILDFGGVGSPETTLLTAVLELGHAVGNRHWDLVVEGECAYLPMADSRDRMEATIDPQLPAGATIRYDTVQPTLFDGDGEAASGDAHSHAGVDHDHSHSHHESHAPDVRALDSDGGEQP